MSKTSLSTDITNLLNSLPQGFDEEDIEDETTAKVVNAGSNESDQVEIGKRRIRTHNIELLDEKYAGKIGSRKDFVDSDCEDDPSETFSNDERSSESDKEESDLDNSHGMRENEDDEEESDSYNSDEESDQIEDEEGNDCESDSEMNGDSNFDHFSKSTSTQEGNKAQGVRTQLKFWENLLEMRIKWRRGLSASNKMPIGEKFNEILSKSTEELKNKLSQTNRDLSILLEKMITLNTSLIKNYPETRKIFSKKRKQEENEDDDEEITSDEESEGESDIKRRKIQDYDKDLAERHENYKSYRNKTIEKWYDKTRIKHTDINSHTLVDQINHILMDKSKLLKKSQLKKSNYNVIGEVEEEEESNVNIYDDEDFYHQQLKELVEFKSSDITDPLQLSRQWVQLQSMRSKMKRKYDTRATKGRKIKYTEKSKMINFLAPRNNEQSEEERQQYLRSICQSSK